VVADPPALDGVLGARSFDVHLERRAVVLWSTARGLSLLTIAGFCVATVGLFARHSWWETAAIGSAVVGLLALIPYAFASALGGETTGTVAWNATVHVLMVAGIFALLLIPQLERWVQHHVMSG
jgi:cell shape-determining protein MreD